MNILFLLGNGFDLNLGLNTKFSDVLDYYVANKSCDRKINKFKNELRKNREQWWSDFEMQLGKYAKIVKNNNYKDYELQYKDFIQYTITFLKAQEKRIDYIKYKKNIAEIFYNSITKYYNYLSDDIKDVLFTVIKENKNVSYNYNFLTFNYTNILDEFVKLTNEQYKVSYNNYGAYHVKKEGCHYIDKILHIHGTLIEDFIVGVDNKEQIDNEDLRKNDLFLAKFVKSITNIELRKNIVSNAEKLIQDSQIILSFGMSIGETDKTWWNYIINSLKIDLKKHFIIIYYNDYFDKRLPITKIDIKGEVLDKLFKNIENITNDEIKDIKKRIHITTNNKNMFQINMELLPCELDKQHSICNYQK